MNIDDIEFELKKSHCEVLYYMEQYDALGCALSFCGSSKSLRDAADELIEYGYVVGVDYNCLRELTEKGKMLTKAIRAHEARNIRNRMTK